MEPNHAENRNPRTNLYRATSNTDDGGHVRGVVCMSASGVLE